MYICTIVSNSSTGREYEVDTRSAMKCADRFGRHESGEVITVRTKTGRIISEARYTPEDGGKYFRAEV